MMDALVWIGTFAVVGVLGSMLIKLGVPSEYSGLFAIAILFGVIYVQQADPWMIQRWKRRWRNWRK